MRARRGDRGDISCSHLEHVHHRDVCLRLVDSFQVCVLVNACTSREPRFLSKANVDMQRVQQAAKLGMVPLCPACRSVSRPHCSNAFDHWCQRCVGHRRCKCVEFKHWSQRSVAHDERDSHRKFNLKAPRHRMYSQRQVSKQHVCM